MWHRIDRELEARRARHRVPSSWADIARALATTEQRVNNWKRRRIPAAQYAPLAAIFGWSVDQLLGLAEGSDRPGPAAPPPDFHDRHVVTDTDWARLQELRDMESSPALARRLDELRAELAERKQFAENVYRRRIEEAQAHGGHAGGMSVFGDLDEEAAAPAVPAKKRGHK